MKHKNLTSQITLSSSDVCEVISVKPPPLTDAMKNKANVLGSVGLEESKLETFRMPDITETGLIANVDVSSDPLRTFSRLSDAIKNKLKVLGTDLGNEEEDEPAQALSKPMTDALRNKIKMHSVAQDAEEVINQVRDFSKLSSDAMRNKIKSMGSEFGVESTDEAELEPPIITEAMKNKIKIMGTEYNIYLDPVEQTNPAEILTDAMKNKMKMMGSSYSDTENATDASKKPEKLTEAQRNKLKVLGSEYNLPPQQIVNENLGVLSDLQRNRIRMNRTDALEVSVTSKQPKTREIPTTEIADNFMSQSVKTVSPKISSANLPKSFISGLEQNEMMEAVTNRLRPPLISFGTLSNYFSNPSQLFPSIPQINGSEIKPTLDDLEIGMFARHLQRSINIAVTVQERLANAAILNHFLLKENFMAHLTSLRCYFLLHDGEFSRSLTNGLFQLLASTSESHQFFDRSALSGILNEALIYTSHGSNSNAQNLSFEIWKMPRQLNPEAHDVLTPFQLSYKVRWPVNIIITEASLEKYRKVFHVLVNLKRVHWTLNETFLLLKTQTKDNTLDGKRLMNSPEYTKVSYRLFRYIRMTNTRYGKIWRYGQTLMGLN